MSSSMKTDNLKLNQWLAMDPVLMADFNADNKKLDAAIHQLQANELLFHFGSYVGNETYGPNNPNVLTFPFVPLLLFVQIRFSTRAMAKAFFALRGVQRVYPAVGSTADYVIDLTWEGNTVSWYAENSYTTQMNEASNLYTPYYYMAVGHDVSGS